MATFNKNIVNGYGTMEAFAKADGCSKVYESDTGYHTVRISSDEESILTSPYLQNLHVVWEQGQKGFNNSKVEAPVEIPPLQTQSPSIAATVVQPSVLQPKPKGTPAPATSPTRQFKTITHLLSIFLPGVIVGLFLIFVLAESPGTSISDTLIGLVSATIGISLCSLVYYAIGGGFEWNKKGLSFIRLVIFWVLSGFLYGLGFMLVWYLIRFVMAKIFGIPWGDARGCLIKQAPRDKTMWRSTYRSSGYGRRSYGSSFSVSKSCSACGRPVSAIAAAGQRCPHCGAYWSYERQIRR